MLATFIGVSQETWNAWAPWAEVAVTLVVGGGALWLAWRQLGHLRDEARDGRKASEDQLSAIQAQVKHAADAVQQARVSSGEQLAAMERARRTQLEPLVVPVGFRFREYPLGQGKGYVAELALKNIGSGPAFNVTAECWFFPAPPESLPAAESVPVAVEALLMEMQREPYRSAKMHLAAGVSSVDQVATPFSADNAVFLSDGYMALARTAFHSQFCDDPLKCPDPLVYPRSSPPAAPTLLPREWPNDL